MAYKQADIRDALSYLALYAGNALLAARALKEEKSLTVTPQKLREWRTGEHADLYDELREAMPDATGVIIRETLETARMAAITERLAIERTHHQLETGEMKDPARAARDLSHIKATNVEKFLTLTGRPTEIVRHESPADIFAGLLADGVIKAASAGDLPAGDGMVFELPEDAVQELPAPEEPEGTRK